MDLLDPAFKSTAVSGVKPLLTLAIAGLGSFSLGALITAIRRGISENGWFKLIKGEARLSNFFFKPLI